MMFPAWVFLLSGIGLALLTGQASHWKKNSKKWGSRVLQTSIVLMGAKIPLGQLVEASTEGLKVTFISVAGVLALGALFYRWIHLQRNQAVLISAGTAICGGSAIGAVSPILPASSLDMGVSLAVVFVLNAVALLLFPPLGHALGLNDHQFALWAALAIHDTSSVVGAGAQWSETALQMATTIKLSRTLWIFPMALAVASANRRWGAVPSQGQNLRPPFPLFILGFIAVSVASTYFLQPHFPNIPKLLTQASSLGFGISLFLIGLSLSREQIRSVGLNPWLYGLALWTVTLVASLIYVKFFVF